MKLYNRGPKLALGIFFMMSLLVALIWAGQASLTAQEAEPVGELELNRVMQAMLENPPVIQDLEALAFTPCTGGSAAGYACDNVDLLSFTPIGTVGGSVGADAWGWIDSTTGKEYAIMNRQNGTGFLDITDPENPVYLGNLPTSTGVTSWRDAKVYSDTVYIVSDGNGSHGMQVFDLTELRDVMTPPETFTETNLYTGINSAHNMVINEESGYGYIVGGSGGGNTCSGGLHMLDLSDPHNPAFVGCHSSSGYTHDAQCVNYIGPDPDHQGDEICMNYNGNSGIFIVDVTDKANTQQLSFTSYPQQDYTHQGWVTDDHRYLVMDDELDELSFGINTRTRIFDITDLDAPPVLVDFFSAPVASTDHNLYLKDGIAYEANYSSGMRLIDISGLADGDLSQVGYFDTFSPDNNAGFSGAWTAYPYYDSGNVIINSRGEGLFVVRPRLLQISKSDPVGILLPGENITYTITVTNTGLTTATGVVVTDTLNGVDTVLSGPTSIDPGASATYEFSLLLDQDDCDTNLTNSAAVSAGNAIGKTTDLPVVSSVNCTDPEEYDVYLPYMASHE